MKKFVLMLALATMLPMAMNAKEGNDSIKVSEAQSTFRMAADLAKYGYANNDALSLIQAARLSKQAGLKEEQRAKAEETGQTNSSKEKKEGNISLDPTKLLADAKSKASNDGVLLALIEDVQSNVRGASQGEIYHTDRVRAKGTDVYNIRFRAGETAIVTVIGDGDTDLDLYVYDENGNLIDSDTDYTDSCVCTFNPRWTGNFRIKIVNRGNVYNNYVLATN